MLLMSNTEINLKLMYVLLILWLN